MLKKPPWPLKTLLAICTCFFSLSPEGCIVTVRRSKTQRGGISEVLVLLRNQGSRYRQGNSEPGKSPKASLDMRIFPVARSYFSFKLLYCL